MKPFEDWVAGLVRNVCGELCDIANGLKEFATSWMDEIVPRLEFGKEASTAECVVLHELLLLTY